MKHLENNTEQKAQLEMKNREGTQEVPADPTQSIEEFFGKHPYAETVSEAKIERLADESGPEVAMAQVMDEEMALREQLHDWVQALPQELQPAFPGDLASLMTPDRHILLDSDTEAMIAKIFTKKGIESNRADEIANDMIARLSTIAVAAEVTDRLKSQIQKEIDQTLEVKKAALRGDAQ